MGSLGLWTMPRQGSRGIGEMQNGVEPGQKFLRAERNMAPTVFESQNVDEARELEDRRCKAWHAKFGNVDWTQTCIPNTPRSLQAQREDQDRYRGAKHRGPLRSARGVMADPCFLHHQPSNIKRQLHSSRRLSKPRECYRDRVINLQNRPAQNTPRK